MLPTKGAAARKGPSVDLRVLTSDEKMQLLQDLLHDTQARLQSPPTVKPPAIRTETLHSIDAGNTPFPKTKFKEQSMVHWVDDTSIRPRVPRAPSADDTDASTPTKAPTLHFQLPLPSHHPTAPRSLNADPFDHPIASSSTSASVDLDTPFGYDQAIPPKAKGRQHQIPPRNIVTRSTSRATTSPPERRQRLPSQEPATAEPFSRMGAKKTAVGGKAVYAGTGPDFISRSGSRVDDDTNSERGDIDEHDRGRGRRETHHHTEDDGQEQGFVETGRADDDGGSMQLEGGFEGSGEDHESGDDGSYDEKEAGGSSAGDEQASIPNKASFPCETHVCRGQALTCFECRQHLQ